MFDKIVAVVPPGRQEHHNHITVNVPEASPEKAAQLLDGLRKEAAEHVRNAILIDVPDIECQVVSYELHQNPHELAYQHRVAFTINGRHYDIALRHSDDLNRQQIAEEVCLAVARAIMQQTVTYAPVAWKSLLGR